MKKKTILCLILIGLVSFNFIGCTSNDKNTNQKSEQQESIANKSSKTDNDSDIKISANNKIIHDQEKDKVVKENNTNTKITQESKNQIYKNKLDNIQSGMKDLENIDATGSNGAIISAASEKHKRWDNALNEIYGVLRQQLSSDDMNKLKKEEIKWISYRDDKAKKDSLQYEGGRLYEYLYRLSLAQTTKERCYELVEKYMK